MPVTDEERELYRINRVVKTMGSGGLTADLMADGSLRSIRWKGTELLRHVYAAVRDENWGTVPPVLSDWEFSEDEGSAQIVRFRAGHREGAVSYSWTGLIAVSPEGTLTYEMDGEALDDFRRNRIGFCLLHPLEMAGCCVTLEKPEGAEETIFPELIQPGDPFTDMQGMTVSLGETLGFSLRFEGDLFQTEDQRNWTDGSYKTFCTPLARPYPVEVSRGTKIRQRIVLEVVAESADQDLSGDHVSDRPDANIEADAIYVAAKPMGRLPNLGTTLSPESDLTPQVADKVRALRLSDLRAVVSLEEEAWRETLARSAAAAEAFGTKLHIELCLPYASAELEPFVQILREYATLVQGVSIYPSRLAGAPANVETETLITGASLRACQYTTTGALLQALRGLLADNGIHVEVGGGSRGNFAEWNRSVLPLDQLAFTEFAVNPQVHASDLASVVESLPAQRLAVKTALVKAGSVPVCVSSIALKGEINPYAATDEAVIRSEDRGARSDARLATRFGACWTIGSLGQMAGSGVSALRYFEHAGSLGMMDSAGQTTYPVYEVFRELAGFREAEVLAAGYDSYSYGVLALRKSRQVRVFIANLTEERKAIRLEGPVLQGGAYSIKALGAAAQESNKYSKISCPHSDLTTDIYAH